MNESPNSGKDESIVDVAHPDTIFVGTAYYAMNAIIENLHQRQDIMSYIALKDPDGHLVQRRYIAAFNKLVNSLISTGFVMDSANESGLMILADSCAGRIHKQALVPLAWGAMALLVTLGYISYGGTSVQNVSANSQLVLERASELSGKSYASSIIAEISALKDLADMFSQAKSSVIANSIDEVVDQAATDKAKAMVDLVERYKKQQQIVMSKLQQWVAVIDDSQKSSQNEAVPDAIQKMKSMFGGVIPDAWQAYFLNSIRNICAKCFS